MFKGENEKRIRNFWVSRGMLNKETESKFDNGGQGVKAFLDANKHLNVKIILDRPFV